MNKTLLYVFGLSGAAALIYEVIWTRLLQIVFGSTIYTASTIFAGFLLGFSLGAFFFRKIAQNSEKPLYYLAIIELLIGIYGIIMLFIVRLLSDIYIFLPSSLLFKLALNLLILMPPTILLGAVWPFLNKHYIKDINCIGKESGKLYSINSLGSALGAFVSGFILIPIFGFNLASLSAVLLNFISAFLLFNLQKRSQNPELNQSNLR